jgi:hypothetical protein
MTRLKSDEELQRLAKEYFAQPEDAMTLTDWLVANGLCREWLTPDGRPGVSATDDGMAFGTFLLAKGTAH